MSGTSASKARVRSNKADHAADGDANGAGGGSRPSTSRRSRRHGHGRSSRDRDADGGRSSQPREPETHRAQYNNGRSPEVRGYAQVHGRGQPQGGHEPASPHAAELYGADVGDGGAADDEHGSSSRRQRSRDAVPSSVRRGTYFGLYSAGHSPRRRGQHGGIDGAPAPVPEEEEDGRSRHGTPRSASGRDKSLSNTGPATPGRGEYSHMHSPMTHRHPDPEQYPLGEVHLASTSPMRTGNGPASTPGSGRRGHGSPRHGGSAHAGASPRSPAGGGDRYRSPRTPASGPAAASPEDQEMRKELRRLRHRLRSMSQRLTQQRTLISQQRTALRDAQVAVAASQAQVQRKVRTSPRVGLVLWHARACTRHHAWHRRQVASPLTKA